MRMSCGAEKSAGMRRLARELMFDIGQWVAEQCFLDKNNPALNGPNTSKPRIRHFGHSDSTGLSSPVPGKTGP